MKTKKDVIKEYLEEAQEALIKIDISSAYLQEKYAASNNQRVLEEIGKLQANKKETEEWIAYLTKIKE